MKNLNKTKQKKKKKPVVLKNWLKSLLKKLNTKIVIAIILIIGLTAGIKLLQKQSNLPEIFLQSGFGKIINKPQNSPPASKTTSKTSALADQVNLNSQQAVSIKNISVKRAKKSQAMVQNSFLAKLRIGWQNLTKKFTQNKAVAWLASLFPKKEQKKTKNDYQQRPMIAFQDVYQLAWKKKNLKNYLAQNPQATPEDLAKIYQANNVLGSQVFQDGNTYQITTNQDGQINQILPTGTYQVSVKTFPNFDFTNLPKKIVLADKAISVHLGMKVGSGKAFLRQKFNNDTPLFPHQQVTNEKQQRLAVYLFHDKNNNAKLDQEEKFVPWAGVTLVLEKLEDKGFGKILR